MSETMFAPASWGTRPPPPSCSRLALVVAALERLDRNDANHRRAVDLVRAAKNDNKAIYFVGNGGSAAIASHMAADFLKAGGMVAQCFNDPALLTCLANDLGYEQAFVQPLARHGRPGDVLVAISSSGQSANILKAVEAARGAGMTVVTLSGFSPGNPLRTTGDVNFYVYSDRYGVVEVCHHAILHAVLDELIEHDRNFAEDGECLPLDNSTARVWPG